MPLFPPDGLIFYRPSLGFSGLQAGWAGLKFAAVVRFRVETPCSLRWSRVDMLTGVEHTTPPRASAEFANLILLIRGDLNCVFSEEKLN